MISSLLEKAEVEEKAYNWINAVELYKKIANSFLERKKVAEAAEIYYKIGIAYFRAVDSTETANEYAELTNYSIKAMEEAMNLYKQIGNKPKELECDALAFSMNIMITSSVLEAKKKFNDAYYLLLEVSDLYFKKNDQESYVRTLCWALIFLFHSMMLCSDPKEFEEIHQKAIILAFKAWNISKEIKNFQYLAETLRWEGFLASFSFWFNDIRQDDRLKEYCRKFLLRCEESLKLVDGYNDSFVLGVIYLITGSIYWVFGSQFIEDELEQRKYFNKVIDYLEKGLVFFRKIKEKRMIIYSLFMIITCISRSGRIEYLQKRILNDISEMVELGKIYRDYFMPWFFMSNLTPAFYYTYIAQWSFFTTSQRKSYAVKGIEYALESLKKLACGPFFPSLYQFLTMSHSTLAYLSINMDEKDEHLKKMFQYAKQANEIGEKYKGGISRSAGYNSLYRAYKTLADVAESDKEKIEMLKNAADASEKYINYVVESIGGIINAQMRLGLIYQDIAVLTENKDILLKAKELFLQIIKECLERGYQSYAGAAYEYIARLEDQLDNHFVSANYYEKAQNAYAESLKNIEYIPLKKRVNERINYAKAWILIENAKGYHKQENHLKSRDNYKQSCDILETLPNYKYEAPYYSAWLLQEEAEQLSKQEKHEEALKKFELTINGFNDAIKSLDEYFNRLREKAKKLKIDKLKKVAKLRIEYCTGRIYIEEAKVLRRQGEHLEAAERFASAASKFNYVCSLFQIEQRKRELKALYYLCRAWESMVFAEHYEDPEKFAEAADLFNKTSQLFTEKKMKLLASANSSFCQALENGYIFDKEVETYNKAKLYTKIKAMLRNAANSYGKAGFPKEADWALATSTYFDASWNLIKADGELEMTNRKELLRMGSEYLKSAAGLFAKAGYEHKEAEILERLNMVQKEERILVSALNTISGHSISMSTTGIFAPACPIESSLSTRLSETQKITEEMLRVEEKRIERKKKKVIKQKYEIIYWDILKEYPRVQKRECRVAIAQIGVSSSGNIINEFYEMKISGLLGVRADKIEMIREKVKTFIENAAENGVNILTFPEMIIDLNYNELLKDLSDLAKLYNMYIIPGSYHDQETKRNLSMVISPDGILWKQEKHIPATIHFGNKMFKEAIEVGTFPRKTIVCNTEYGRIAIVICRDFLDMDLRVELKNFEPAVDILLNPAFTPVTADFKAAHFDARRSIYAYCFFANVGEFGDSLIYTPEKELIERTIPLKEEGLIYKDIDLFKLRLERKKWEKEQNKEKLFIQSTR